MVDSYIVVTREGKVVERSGSRPGNVRDRPVEGYEVVTGSGKSVTRYSSSRGGRVVSIDTVRSGGGEPVAPLAGQESSRTFTAADTLAAFDRAAAVEPLAPGSPKPSVSVRERAVVRRPMARLEASPGREETARQFSEFRRSNPELAETERRILRPTALEVESARARDVFLTASFIDPSASRTQQFESERRFGESFVDVPASIAGLGVLGLAGKGAELAGKGATALKATTAGKAVSRVAGNPLVRTGINIGRTAIETDLIVSTAVRQKRLQADVETERIIKTSDFDRAIRAGFSAERQSLGSGLSARGLAFDLSPLLSGNTEAFKGGVEAELRRQGLTAEEASRGARFARGERTTRGIAEIGAVLETSRLAEATGRANVKFAQTMFGGKLGATGGMTFQRAATSIGLAGLIEGFGTERSIERARADEFDIFKQGSAGLIGGGTAAVLGGGIAALKTRSGQGARAAGSTVNILANIADPFEKPADILQDITEKAGFGGRAPVFTLVPSTQPTVAPSGGGRRKVRSVLPGFSSVPTGVPSFVETPGVTPTPVPSVVPVVNPVVPSASFTPTPISTIVPPISPVPVTPSPQVPVSPSPQVPVNVPVSSTVNFPVTLPNFRIPPPIPFFTAPELGGGGGGKKGVVKGRKTIRELDIAARTFGEVVGFGFAPLREPKKKRKKGKAKKSNKGRRGGSLPGFPVFRLPRFF